MPLIRALQIADDAQRAAILAVAQRSNAAGRGRRSMEIFQQLDVIDYTREKARPRLRSRRWTNSRRCPPVRPRSRCGGMAAFAVQRAF